MHLGLTVVDLDHRDVGRGRGGRGGLGAGCIGEDR